MGTNTVGRGRLQRLPKKAEMALIGRMLRPASEGRFVSILKADKTTAKRLGKSVLRARSEFSAAYRGATRDRSFKNKDWRKAGYEHLANLNKLLGLSGS